MGLNPIGEDGLRAIINAIKQNMSIKYLGLEVTYRFCSTPDLIPLFVSIDAFVLEQSINQLISQSVDQRKNRSSNHNQAEISTLYMNSGHVIHMVV